MASYRYRQTVLTEVARRGFYPGLEKVRRQETVEQTASVQGSERGLIMSLLCDHLLNKIALLKNKQPGMPAGCLIERLKMEPLTETVKDVVMADDPEKALEPFAASLQSVVPVRSSSIHMAGLRERVTQFLGFGQTLKLRYRVTRSS